MLCYDISMTFKKLPKLKRGDKVAILSPSFAAPDVFPEVYELGLKRLQDVFGLVPVEYPTTRKVGASGEERSADLIAAFEDSGIKAVITTIGGDDQVTYVKNLPTEPFVQNPKSFFGISDNTHFMQHLWRCGVPSYYGGTLMTQFAMHNTMDAFTIEYLKKALFTDERITLTESKIFNDIGLDWNDPTNLTKKRTYEENDGWQWDGTGKVKGILWGGCLESIDEILRHDIALPSEEEFQNIIIFTETSEEIPSADYVMRVYRALGERGILHRAQAFLVGRPKTQEYNDVRESSVRRAYRKEQREMIKRIVRRYNETCPIIQNMDFGHTDPQICLPMGGKIFIDTKREEIRVQF